MWKKLGFGLLICVTLSYIALLLAFKEPVPPPLIKEGFFGGTADIGVDSTAIDTVKITIPDATLTDLKERLQKTRYFGAIPGTGFSYGFNADYMTEVVKYWVNDYDWRAAEKKLNDYTHLMTIIEGVKVHMTRVSPANGKVGRPLLLLHGWPSTVYEFHKLIPLLTSPSSSDYQPFDLYIPSLPGYGFSLSPAKTGMSPLAMARYIHTWMQRLNVTRYYVHGTDWGGQIGTIMSQVYPQEVIGFHTNMFPVDVFYNANTLIKTVLSNFFPSYYMSPAEMNFAPTGRRMLELIQETGYFHIQSTRPDTVAFGLNDSPVGLAAYILEKYAVWTNLDMLTSKDGGLTAKFSLHDLLTQVTIFWTNGNIAPSMRIYKEFMTDPACQIYSRLPVTVPVGLAAFPREVFNTPYFMAAEKYTDLVQYSVQARGGHFPALEEPELLAEDIFLFVHKLNKRSGTPDGRVEL